MGRDWPVKSRWGKTTPSTARPRRRFPPTRFRSLSAIIQERTLLNFCRAGPNFAGSARTGRSNDFGCRRLRIGMTRKAGAAKLPKEPGRKPGRSYRFLTRRSRNQTGSNAESWSLPKSAHQRPVNIGCEARRENNSAMNMQNPDVKVLTYRESFPLQLARYHGT